jgi:hypothetical protein
MLYTGDERHAGRHILSDNRLKLRVVRRAHTRATTDTCQQRRSKQNESNGPQLAAPAALPRFFILVPQCGHSHSPNNACDLSNGTRRSDIGVAQLEQCPGLSSFEGARRRRPASTTPSATKATMRARKSQLMPSMTSDLPEILTAF